MVCIRWGAEVPDGKGPGSMGICGGCAGGECRVKEVEGKKVVLIPGFFSRSSTPDEAVRAGEEMAKARDEKVNAEIALQKASDEKEEKNIDIVKFAKDAKYREQMLGVGEQRSSNKLMEPKFGDNWLDEQAIEL